MFNFVAPLEPHKVAVINAVNNKDVPGYCNKCGDSLYDSAKGQITIDIEETKKALFQSMSHMPVVSAQNPLHWDYEVLTMVTGQSTTGTGVVSEFLSSWTDLFGAQSGAYNQKLRNGEILCFQQVRKQALDLGANAVIATDIDYSEVGGDKGMLMVCMAGTAVRLKNPDVLGADRKQKLEEAVSLNEKLNKLQQLAKVPAQ